MNASSLNSREVLGRVDLVSFEVKVHGFSQCLTASSSVRLWWGTQRNGTNLVCEFVIEKIKKKEAERKKIRELSFTISWVWWIYGGGVVSFAYFIYCLSSLWLWVYDNVKSLSLTHKSYLSDAWHVVYLQNIYISIFQQIVYL